MVQLGFSDFHAQMDKKHCKQVINRMCWVVIRHWPKQRRAFENTIEPHAEVYYIVNDLNRELIQCILLFATHLGQFTYNSVQQILCF